MPEKELEANIKELAKMLGYKYYHTWRSFHSPAGWPDCALVKPPRIIYAELKVGKNKPSPAQIEWLDTLSEIPGNEVYLWYDWHDINDIAKILQGLPQDGIKTWKEQRQFMAIK